MVKEALTFNISKSKLSSNMKIYKSEINVGGGQRVAKKIFAEWLPNAYTAHRRTRNKRKRSLKILGKKITKVSNNYLTS